MQKSKRSNILPSDIDDQRVLQSDWMRDTTGLTQLKVAVSDAAKKLRYHLILSRDTDDQRFINRIGQEVQLATPNLKS